jgi:hypothetical protein
MGFGYVKGVTHDPARRAWGETAGGRRRFNALFWRRWDRAETSRAGEPRGQLEAVLDMVAATASHPKWRSCPFLNTGTEFPEPDHPARAVILATSGLSESVSGLLLQRQGPATPNCSPSSCS